MQASRYVVVGLGAVGGAIAARLLLTGSVVTGIARGAQLAALRDGPLWLDAPSGSEAVRLDVVERPRDLRFTSGDVILLCTKLQDVTAALDALREAAPAGVPIVCAQNGVAAESLATARFERVYGMVVFSPASHLEPGRVALHAEPLRGVLDIGVHPRGTDALAENVARDLQRAGFEAHAEPEILRLKYGKLLTNVANVLQALAGNDALPLVRAVQEETIACYRAAGVAYAPLEELDARYGAVREQPVRGEARGGGSTWQSLARRAGSIETAYLNGEIVRLAAAAGVDAPKNRALVALAGRAVREGWPPAHLSVAELARALEDAA